eukprot:5158435-Prymnesium_polylepis.1
MVELPNRGEHVPSRRASKESAAPRPSATISGEAGPSGKGLSGKGPLLCRGLSGEGPSLGAWW